LADSVSATGLSYIGKAREPRRAVQAISFIISGWSGARLGRASAGAFADGAHGFLALHGLQAKVLEQGCVAVVTLHSARSAACRR